MSIARLPEFQKTYFNKRRCDGLAVARPYGVAFESEGECAFNQPPSSIPTYCKL
jgi:hypothetical protein